VYFVGLGRRSSSFGEGVAIAPEWLRFDIAQRFVDGRLQASASVSYGYYVDEADGVNQGYELVLGVKLQWTINRRWRTWLSATGQQTTDSAGTPTLTGSIALGVRAKF
jgi:hypothetical protein